MLTKADFMKAKGQTLMYLEKSSIILSDEEKEKVEIADFGLNNLEVEGLEIITYINTDNYCAKELVLFPNQTCPEHKHPPIQNHEGKTETFRCRWGKVWLYVEGKAKKEINATIPVESRDYYTVFHEVELNPGDQYTIPPNTLHWFQSSEDGAIVSEFSTTSRDEYDIFTDPRIKRVP